MTIGWTENATRAGGNGTLSEAQVEAILGTAVTYGGTSTVTLAGSGTQTWTLTIGDAALTEGVTETDAVNGTDNNAVTDSSSNPQTPTTGVTLTAGPRIADTDLTTNAGALGFKEVGDVLTITWNEAATRTGGNGTLTEAQLEAVLGTPVAYAASSTVTLAGSGTITWTLTIGGADLTEGIADNDPTPGTNNAAVTNSGDPQLPSAATFDVGPAITATRLTSSTGANTTWDAVDEVLTITWNEAATRAGGDGTLTEPEVEAILGTTVEYTDSLTDTTVTLVGSGTSTWSLTIGTQPLAEGVAENDATNGTNNAGVTNDGDRQVATTGAAMNVGPRISSARLTAGLGSWNAVGNVITITWTEDAVWVPATATLTETQVKAILGVEIRYGVNTTVTLAGSGTDSWTLTVGGEALDEGVTIGDSTNGTNNTSVVDEHAVVAAPQLLTSGRTLTLV